MAQDHTYRLEELIFELTEIQASDILVHADLSSKEIIPLTFPLQETYSFPQDVRWHAILKHTVRHKRQSDTDTLCLGAYGILWEYKGRQVVSPLWLIPAAYRINKIKQEIELTTDPGQAIFNPFVKNELKRRYDLEYIPEDSQTQIEQRSEGFYRFLRQHDFPFQASELLAFGNFHHHRYLIVKDLEALLAMKPNPLVSELLGDPQGVRQQEIPLTAQCIVPADKDQQEVFRQAACGNLVVQGPPGTGKSQVLTNLVAKLLDKGETMLIVSEKTAALEVLVKKLEAHGLDAFAFVAGNRSRPADFVNRLKNTWNLLEGRSPRPEQNLMLSRQLIAALQLKLDKLASTRLIGGVSLGTFRQLLAGKETGDLPYDSDVPDVAEWLEFLPEIGKLDKESLHGLKFFRQKALTHAETLDRALGRLAEQVSILSAQAGFSTFSELEARLPQTARAQILENESYKRYAKLFTSERERKKLNKLRIAFLQQQEAFALIASEKLHWKQPPSHTMALSWKEALSGSWWKRRKASGEIRALLLSASINPSLATENWLMYLERERQLQDTVAALQQMGIDDPATALESISYLLRQLEKTSGTELSEVAALSAVTRQALAASGQALFQAHRALKELLHYHPSDEVVKTLREALESLPGVLRESRRLAGLPPRIYRLLQKYTPAEAELQVLRSNWMQFVSRFPELAMFDGEALKEALHKIGMTEKEEHRQFGIQLLADRYARFGSFHELLRTPAGKLTSEDKIWKARLKAGKSILVKEFSKTRQHQTIRELLDSDARPWIELLTPVWLSTPVQVATSFPAEKGLFGHVIFDEASQIPLSHALGALQRAGRAIVAGDEQQMAPSDHFSGRGESADLLHQASYYWPRVSLRHHYRSMHPALIGFSNRYFYNNELIAYPAAGQVSAPVRLHYVDGAVYDGRKNIREAQAVALKAAAMLDTPGTLGIVAFSEQQLDCIWKQLPAAARQRLSERTEDNTAFMRALEQVQGDECDHLVVSLGYGKDPDGQFHLRFGPLNRAGGSRRLNVLLSRAKLSVDFFHSVKAEDMPLSTNEAVNLLRYFLLRDEDTEPLIFPFGLVPRIEGNKLFFEAITEQLQDAEELAVLQAVLELRGWEVSYSI